MKTRTTLAITVAALLSPAAYSQQMDMAAMQKWASSDLIKYHIVGVFQAAIPISSDSAGLADVGDRVVIDLTWKMSQQAMTAPPTIQNFKSTTANLRDPTPACLAPVLHGEYEHYDLLSVKGGLAGALDFTASTSYPVVDAAFRCTMSRKPVPAKVVTRTVDFSLPSVVLFGMPIEPSDALTISPDKKFFTAKKDGWTWTITPTKVGK